MRVAPEMVAALPQFDTIVQYDVGHDHGRLVPRPRASISRTPLEIAIPHGDLSMTLTIQSAIRPQFRTIDGLSVRLSLIHISEPTRLLSISYAVFCLKKKK